MGRGGTHVNTPLKRLIEGHSKRPCARHELVRADGLWWRAPLPRCVHVSDLNTRQTAHDGPAVVREVGDS